ncbi:LysR family transcriptional regulator [Silvanigrella paludirubra]|uniref:LysR family transcriptional regulator n=1 Tax=Silvanigrella paludirubra TaxID=2499159 RepID=A0A6N6VR43_9BACT|nr:LysR family transcriptional regulator [Silvanigrella paludirubra]KAB8037880.1 LysR family transcriptional regulator [Silvanigrella paludirubra]
MDRFEAMSILVAVADGGSLSQASRKLKIPLASVSRKLSELESYLNVKLLTRTTRALEFTDYGRSYVAHCRRILDDISEAERAVTGEYTAPKGILTITAPIVFGKIHIIPILSEFLKAYPEVDVQLMLTDRGVDLLEEKIDLALRIGELPSSSLIAVRVGEIRHLTCGSSFYFKKRLKPKNPQDLQSHDCISITALGASKNWVFYSGKSKLNVAIRPRLEVTTAEAGIEAAVLGVGITRALSYQVSSYLNNNKLEIILEDYEPDPWPVHLVHAAGRIVPLKLRAFLDFAKPRLKLALSNINNRK